MPLTMPDTPNTYVPDDAAVAAALGLEDLHAGRHYLRGEDRGRTGAIWLDAYWMLRIRPAFHDHGLVGVASCHGEEFRKRTSTGWIKGLLASNGALVVQEFDSDPLPTVLAGIPLLRRSDWLSLDGVSYQLHAATIAVTCILDFRNPKIPELVAVERVCWEVADNIARRSGDAVLTDFTATWRGYHDRGA
jgi:hypothetical protein